MTYTMNSCYDCCLSYPAYGCIYTPYNDTSFYEALAASGALSLGTTAGTDRSISAEFGGTTPHALSEYYGCATGIPASGAIDFSDFHGTSSGPPVSDCLWTHYDFSGCSTGTIEKWGTTSNATECQCMKAYYWQCCSGSVAHLTAVAAVDTSGSCICKDSSCWNGNAFLGLSPIYVGNLGTTRPMAASHTGRANWLSACYGTSDPVIDTSCGASTRFMVFGGQHAINGNFVPWAHTGMLGMYPRAGNQQFYLNDTTATGRCGSLAGCGAWRPQVVNMQLQFECLINSCTIAMDGAYGHNQSNYPGLARWCAESSADCAPLSRASTNGPVVMSMRFNPQYDTYVNYWPWVGTERFTIGWITKCCVPIIDDEPNWTSDSLNPRRYYWKTLGIAGGVCTTIPCGGFDFWNSPIYFGQSTTATGTPVVDCFQVGEFLVYNCSLTDAQYCCVLNYLHDKWQADI